VWYAHHGWFEARFDGWEVHRIRRGGRKRAGVVRIVGHVEPGPPSLVRGFEITGLDTVPLRVFGQTVRRTGYVAEGSQFDLESTDLTRDLLLGLLADHGYPHARVGVDVQAFPDAREVDVRFDVDSGPSARFGEVSVEGLERVAERVVRDAITITPGEAFDRAELGISQQRLFALGAFSLVNVEPELSDPEADVVPVTIKLTETRFRTFRLGGGADVDSGLVTPRVSTGWRHVYLFRRLLRADAAATVGYALGRTDREAGRETYSVSGSLSAPQLAGPRWQLRAATEVVREVQAQQYAYFRPSASTRLTYKPLWWVALDLGPSLQLYRIVGGSQENEALLGRLLFGVDRAEYALLTVDGGVTADWRDDPLNTTRGSYYRLGLRQALPTPAGRYVFTDLVGEARTYARVRLGDRTPFTLAARLRARALLPFNDQGIPYPEKSFQGGSASLRGFRTNQVGAYETLCTYTPGRVADGFSGQPYAGEELTLRHLPVGGEADALASVEARVDWAYGISVAPFVDAGLLAPTLGEIHPRHARVAAGIGFRYASLVGPIRFDVAVRPLYPEDGLPRAVVGCRAGDVVPRAFDALSAFQKQRDPDTRSIPFAIGFTIAIGQAF
jgi:outer membrane protein assembly factor BamA